jgi:hypothetical protein
VTSEFAALPKQFIASAVWPLIRKTLEPSLVSPHFSPHCESVDRWSRTLPRSAGFGRASVPLAILAFPLLRKTPGETPTPPNRAACTITVYAASIVRNPSERLKTTSSAGKPPFSRNLQPPSPNDETSIMMKMNAFRNSVDKRHVWQRPCIN